MALTVHPDDGLLSEDDFECSDADIIKIEEIKDGKLILKSLEKEGLVTLQYKKDDVKSNSVTIQVVNQQALAMAKAKRQRKNKLKKLNNKRMQRKLKNKKSLMKKRKANKRRKMLHKQQVNVHLHNQTKAHQHHLQIKVIIQIVPWFTFLKLVKSIIRMLTAVI